MNQPGVHSIHVHAQGGKLWAMMVRRRRKGSRAFFFMLLLSALLGIAACGSSRSGVFSGEYWGSHVMAFIPSGIRYGSVALSPSRRLLACERLDHDRGAHDILILPLFETAPSEPVIVANGESPTWLSNEHILFYRDDAQGNADIWMASVGQPGAQALTETPAAEESVSVAPDGYRLLIARAMIGHDYERSEQAIILAEIRDGRISEIATHVRADAERGNPYSPHWSPDGQNFAYERVTQRRGSVIDLYVMRTDGSDDRLLVRDARLVAWAADGQSIYYQTRTRGDVNGEVRRIDADGQGNRLVLVDTYVPARRTPDNPWNLRRDRLALATEDLVGAYDATGFRTPTGIVLLNNAGEVLLDLRTAGRTDVLEGGVHWDADDRLVFARHTATKWHFQGPHGGIFSLDPVSGEERTILADTESYTEKSMLPADLRARQDR